MLCYTSLVANKLRRYYGAGYLHFITTKLKFWKIA